MWLIYNIIVIILIILLLIYLYFKWRYQYWSRLGVQQLPPKVPYGNLPSPFNRQKAIGIYIKELYNQMKVYQWDYGGIYSLNDPTLLILNLDLIRNVMTKDFQYFTDRGVYYNEKDDPLSAHLFAIGGVKWRQLRTKLTPTFTSGKMRQMFQTLVECEEKLTRQLDDYYRSGKPLDIKEILGCFTTDIIGSVAFGLDFNTFQSTNSPFRRYGKRVFKPTTYEIFKSVFGENFRTFAYLLRMKIIPDDVAKFFTQLVRDTVMYRERNHFTRKDFIQILIDMKNNRENIDDNRLTVDELAAQCFIFFLAGFETSSTTMTFALYELARQPRIQQKLRKEINDVLQKHNNQITYDAIKDMKYMNQVIKETLRKYPPLPFVTRQCVRDYQLTPKLRINKGTHIIIPIMGVHNDPELYPDPQHFDPERFSDEMVQKRHQYAHIPFGEGPRICIGLRFGMVQTKLGITSLLRNYQIKINPRTQEPIKMHKNSFILAAEGDIWLDVEKIPAA
nr:cytochrome P450 6a23 [Epicauta chinensis]